MSGEGIRRLWRKGKVEQDGGSGGEASSRCKLCGQGGPTIPYEAKDVLSKTRR